MQRGDRELSKKKQTINSSHFQHFNLLLFFFFSWIRLPAQMSCASFPEPTFRVIFISEHSHLARSAA